MGMVLNLSEPSVDRMIYGDRSNFLAGYLAQQMQQIGPVFNEFTQRVVNTIQNSYDFVTNKLVQYGIRNELSQVGLNVLDNYYMELTSWQALQDANPTMQRVVMCHPGVKQLYNDQNIDGYSDQYRNIFGKGVGEEDYNYRLYMSGVIRDISDDESKYSLYLEDLMPGDRRPDHYEKDIAINTHAAIDWILENTKFDFTCKSDEPTKINRS